jgi:hypothetical protein
MGSVHKRLVGVIMVIRVGKDQSFERNKGRVTAMGERVIMVTVREGLRLLDSIDARIR